MNERKIIRKFWWPWQADKIERLLEEQAAQGWMFVSSGPMCIAFVFEKREPLKIRYGIDYQEKQKPEYLTVLGDAGWHMIHRASGWYIWAKPYGDVRPDLYTDIDSILRRNQMILGSLTAVFAAQIPLFTVNMSNMANMHEVNPFMIGVYSLWAVIFGVLLYVVVRMSIGVQKLAKLKKERT